MAQILTGSLILDSDKTIQNFNNEAAVLYPHLKKGAKCYQALQDSDSPCLNCPLFAQGNSKDCAENIPYACSAGNRLTIPTAQGSANIVLTFSFMDFEAKFEKAIAEKNFVIWYQPQYDSEAETVVGAEALVRWQTSERIIFPSEFISAFEANGSIERLDKYVFEEVCRRQRKNIDLGKPIIPISVNISHITLFSPNIVEQYIAIIEKYNLPKSIVPIEIKESVALENCKLKPIADAFCQAGFKLYMDDFGSGRSSLNGLNKVDFAVIKIGKGLIDFIGKKSGELILSYTVALAKELGLHVLAEGVDSKEQVDFLKNIGCDMIQGFYFSKPLPEKDFNTTIQPNIKYDKNYAVQKLYALTPTAKTNQVALGGFFTYYAYGDQRLLTSNSYMWKLFGCSTEEEFMEHVHGSFKGIVSPEEYPAVQASIMEQITNNPQKLDFVEYSIIRKDGTRVPVLDYGILVHTNNADIFYVFIIEKNQQYLVTAPVFSQDVIKTYNDVFRSALEKIPGGYNAIINAFANVFISMEYIDLQERTIHKLGYQDNIRLDYGEKGKAEAILNANIDCYVAEKHRQLIKDFVNLDKLNERMGKKNIIAIEYLDTNGVWNRIVFISVKRDAQGNNIAVICASRPIAEEIEALQARDNVITSLATAYEAIFALNSDTGLVTNYRISPARAARYGEQLATAFYGDVLQAYVQNEVVAEDRKLFASISTLAGLHNAIDSRQSYTITYRVMRNEKSKYLQCIFIKPNPERNEFIVGFKDIDEEKRKELAQQQKLENALFVAKEANKAKSNFLFNMSHDIRTPMNAIIGFTELLEANLDDRTKVLSYLEKIKASNEFLLSLVNNVLEMARIESGKEVLDEKVIVSREFSKSFCSLFEAQMKEKGISFSCIDNVQHERMLADSTKIREIFLNILSNALKYTPKGGSVRLLITELPCERKDYALIQTVVEDTGIGMSKQFLPHIFEEFSRENSSTVSRVIGTGLGMPIVKKLVNLMQGTISVESELGKGTKVTITIPHRLADEGIFEANKLQQAVDKASPVTLAGKRILLVEDNDINAEIATAVLEGEGLLIERAEDGIICIDKLQKAAADYYDLILMDIQMPNMDGYKATEIIRRMEDKRKASLPIIAMTANAFEEDKQNAYKAGMNAHIAKPFKVQELLHTLANFL